MIMRIPAGYCKAVLKLLINQWHTRDVKLICGVALVGVMTLSITVADAQTEPGVYAEMMRLYFALNRIVLQCSGHTCAIRARSYSKEADNPGRAGNREPGDYPERQDKGRYFATSIVRKPATPCNWRHLGWGLCAFILVGGY